MLHLGSAIGNRPTVVTVTFTSVKSPAKVPISKKVSYLQYIYMVSTTPFTIDGLPL